MYYLYSARCISINCINVSNTYIDSRLPLPDTHVSIFLTSVMNIRYEYVNTNAPNCIITPLVYNLSHLFTGVATLA